MDARNKTPEQALVTSEADLARVMQKIEEQKLFGIDLEFIPERTYYPIICLIQLAVADEVYLIDPLKLKDRQLDPLWQAMANPSILKVLHAASQDLTIAYQRSGLMPKNIFDTQIAAGFLGLGYPAGYGKLLSSVFNTQLSKTESFTDWQMRPLTPSQIEYAIGDVEHLLGLYRHLHSQLSEAGRLSWVEDECSYFERQDFYVKEPGKEFLKIKGAQALASRKLAVLQELCRYREEEAKRIDKPPRTVLNDNILLEIARKPPQKVEDIKRIRGIRPDQLHHLGDKMIQAVKRALALPDGQCPQWPAGKAPAKSDVLIADILYTILKLRAQDFELAPELIATRDELQSFVRWARQIDGDISRAEQVQGPSLSESWRLELAGKELLAILNGARVDLTINLKSNHSPVKLKLNA